MELIFAKWILTSTMFLTPGAPQDFPRLDAERDSQTIHQSMIAIDVWTSGTICPPAQAGTTCIPTEGGFSSGAMQFHYCVGAAGVYVAHFRLDLGASVPGYGASSGRAWLGSMPLLAFRTADQATHFETALPFVADGPECHSLRYELTGAPVFALPAGTSLTVYRAGQ